MIDNLNSPRSFCASASGERAGVAPYANLILDTSTSSSGPSTQLKDEKESFQVTAKESSMETRWPKDMGRI